MGPRSLCRTGIVVLVHTHTHAGSGLKRTSHWSRGNTGTHPWPTRKACYNGERPDPRTPVWPYRLNRDTW